MIICSQCGLENPKKLKLCQHCGKGLSGEGHFEAGEAMKMLSSEARERYEIKEVLGRGGMGVVYKAYDRRLKRYVALKVLSQELVASRFEREAILAARLEHPNIVIIHDIEKERGKEHISMNYIDGDTLEEILNRSESSLPLERAVEIIKQVCAALSFAHEQGVVHRDIKPSNIIIDLRGKVVITDFGIARATTGVDMTKLTTPGMIIGTPRYMSPEQVKGGEVDQRTDIYAAGIVFYEMLAGKPPFEADTAITLGVKKITEKPKPPREINPFIPEELERIVLRAIEKEPEERYQDMEGFSKELEEYEEIEKKRKKREEEERGKAEELRKEGKKKETEMLRLLEEDERKWEEAETRKEAEALLLEERQKAEEERKGKEAGEERRARLLIREEKRKKKKKEELWSLRWRRLKKGFAIIILLLFLCALAYALFKIIQRETEEESVTQPGVEGGLRESQGE